MSRKFFGEAKDFYRVRIIEICADSTGEEFWESGVNYSGYSPELLIANDITTHSSFRLELVELDDRTIHILSNFEKYLLATRAQNSVRSDLESMTKNEFDKKYLLPKDTAQVVSDRSDLRELMSDTSTDDDQVEPPETPELQNDLNT